MWFGPKRTSVPSGILTHQAVWPQQTWVKNWGAVGLPLGGWVPSNKIWPGPRPTSMLSGILIHPTVWPQYTNVRSCHAHCPAPFQATATMLSPGEVTATAWLLAAYTVTSSPPDSALTRLVHCLACTYRVRALSGGEMTSQLGSQTVAVTSPGKSMVAVA